MDAETDPRQDPEIAALLGQANERDPETGGYSMGALKAQRQLAAMGVAPRTPRTTEPMKVATRTAL